MQVSSILRTLGWIVVFLGISFLIGDVTRENMGWYDTLGKAPLNPPRIAFPIVWTSLYIMLAIAGSYLWSIRKNGNGAKHFRLFAFYMLMNWAWSFIFFASHYITAGFVWIIISDLVLAALVIILFKSQYKKTAFLLSPTLLWGVFAAYLNGYIAFAN